MKKYGIAGAIVVAALVFGLFQNCSPMMTAGTSGASSSSYLTLQSTPDELIMDAAFRDGIDVLPACENPDTNPACANIQRYTFANPNAPDRAGSRPIWELAQWHSTSNLPAQATRMDGGYGAATNTKRIIYFPDGRLELAVSGKDEFPGGYFSKKGVALILGQNIGAPGANQRETGYLSEMNALNFNVDMRRVYEDQRLGAGYDWNRAAAIFPINFTVQNLRVNADGSAPPGYGQYVWLQITPYDDRLAIPGIVDYLDKDTKSFMLSVPYGFLAGASLHGGTWVNMRGNILPRALESIERAYGAGLLSSRDPSDYKIGGVNIGYELSGMNSSTMQFNNLSLRVDRKPAGTGRVIDELSYSSAGPLGGRTCVQLLEPSDPHTWSDNYLCSTRDLGLRWSYDGPISGMACTQIVEPSDPDAWNDNYLCAPADLGLQWSFNGPIGGRKCLQIHEAADPHAWGDNYLCGP